MKISNLDSKETEYLKVTDFENFFNIYVADGKYYLYDLNSTLYISFKSSNIKEFILKTDAQWPLISYLIYDTTRLWWLLCKLNNINIKNIFDIQPTGKKILYMDKHDISNLLDIINNEE